MLSVGTGRSLYWVDHVFVIIIVFLLIFSVIASCLSLFFMTDQIWLYLAEIFPRHWDLSPADFTADHVRIVAWAPLPVKEMPKFPSVA
jgi:hypothetical protein